MRRLSFFAGLCLLFLYCLAAGGKTASAQAGDAYALVDAVNRLRIANGLPAYEINFTLMAIAQAHSDYQAAIGTVTHTGAGGSRPRDRAIAAGYGNGATVFISENIAGGTNLSPERAVEWWQGDAPHLNTMLGANYKEIGAGAAISGSFVYYTIDVGYVAGSGSVAPTSIPGSGVTPATPGPTPLPIFAVQVATPGPDGSIVHVVRPGQALIIIADAYRITLNELLALNRLERDAIIYPEDKLTVRLASPPTATEIITDTPTPRPPTPTRRPTRTPAPSDPQESPALAVAMGDTPPTIPASSGLAQIKPDTVGNVLLAAVAVLVAAGLALILLGSAIKRST